MVIVALLGHFDLFPSLIFQPSQLIERAMPASSDNKATERSEKIMSSFRYRPEILEGLPEHLTENLKQFEDWFLLEASDLKRITEHFVKELEKGLTKEGGNIVSIPVVVYRNPGRVFY